MPTYEYECRACAHRFEAFQSMSEAPISLCPQCGASVRRMIGGGTGIIFKGSGFYVTDSKPKSSTKASPASSSTAQKAEPAAAAEAKASDSSKAPDAAKAPDAQVKKESA